MTANNFELNLYGQRSRNYEDIKQEISAYLTKINLPLTIVENQHSPEIMAIYKEDGFLLNKSNELQSFFDFLLKINPKTGKVCKCNDCNYCPSKRLEAITKQGELVEAKL